MAKAQHEELFRMAKRRMLSALLAFYAWKWLTQAMNTNSVGKEMAESNVEVMNRHKNFFTQVLSSNLNSFVIDLCVFFEGDKYEDSFSFDKLVDSLLKLNEKERSRLKKKLNSFKVGHRVLIKKLKRLRNKSIAHQSISLKTNKRPALFLVYAQIEGVFKAVEKMLNLVSKTHDRSVTMWDHIEKQVIRELKWAFDNLKRGERVRLDEINKKYGKL